MGPVAAMPNAAASCSSFCSCFHAATFNSHNTATCSFKLRPATMFTFDIRFAVYREYVVLIIQGQTRSANALSLK